MEQIYNFVSRNKFSHASRVVCTRIVGGGFMGIDEEVLEELKEKLPAVADEELQACYYMIK